MKLLFKNKGVTLTLYNSLVRPHLEYLVQFWSPHQTKDFLILKGVQCRETKNDPFCATNSRKKKLSTLKMFSLEKRRCRGKLIECFKILTGFTSVDKTKLFMIDDTVNEE